LENWEAWVGYKYRYMGKGKGCHLPAFLDLPILKCACKEHIIDIIDDIEDPLEALWQSE